MVPWIISHIFIRQTKLTLTFVTFCVTFLNFAAKTPFSAQFTCQEIVKADVGKGAEQDVNANRQDCNARHFVLVRELVTRVSHLLS